MPERNAVDSLQMFSISVAKFPTFLCFFVFTRKEVNRAHPNWTCNVRRPELLADKERLTTEMRFIRVGD